METKTKLKWQIKVAGILLLIYGLFECSDVFRALAAWLGLVSLAKGGYPEFYFGAINDLFTRSPMYSFLFTLVPTSLRLVSGIGVLMNRMWGFWFAVIVSMYTFSVFTLFLPVGAVDGIFTVIVLVFLLIGYFGKKEIV